MTVYVGLLRGVNVGGATKLPMADLRRIAEGCGFEDVRTYVQSGNVVFSHRAKAHDKLEADLERRIKAMAGFDVAVFVRSVSEWTKVVRNNPYPGTEPTKLVVSFLKQPPPRAAWQKIDADAFLPEAFTVKGREVYLYLPNGQGRAKLPQALNRIPGTATTRNWQTVCKLLDLVNA